MKLNKRGERVFAFTLVFTALGITSLVVAGGVFLATHKVVTDKATCHYSADADGIMCGTKWVTK